MVPHGAASPGRDAGAVGGHRRRNPAQRGPAGSRPGRQGALWQHAASASSESHGREGRKASREGAPGPRMSG